jgi:HK97 gp10 family phage protein
MAQVSIKIKNINEIRQAFSQAPNLMNRELKDALNRSAITVQGRSMQNTPVITGRLRSSHVFAVSGSGMGMQAVVYPTANYGIFVHEGTRFQRPQPFLKDGLESSADEIQGYFQKATQNVFDKIGRQT